MYNQQNPVEILKLIFVIIRNEKANDNYSTDFLYRLYSEEGKDTFTARMNVLGTFADVCGCAGLDLNSPLALIGHMQQGGCPSPFDRNLGTKLAARAVDWMVKKLQESLLDDGSVCADQPDSAIVLGIIKRNYTFTPLQQLGQSTDFKYGHQVFCLFVIRC